MAVLSSGFGRNALSGGPGGSSKKRVICTKDPAKVGAKQSGRTLTRGIAWRVAWCRCRALARCLAGTRRAGGGGCTLAAGLSALKSGSGASFERGGLDPSGHWAGARGSGAASPQ